MTRAHRRWTTWICLAGFAFAQLTLAAYACPLRAPAPAAMAADATLERCPGHASTAVPDNGPLCEVHCEGQTGVPGGSTLVVPPVVLAPFPVPVSFDVDPVAVMRASRVPLDANAAAPPVAQRFCRLLI